jgi:hypothetical protein
MDASKPSVKQDLIMELTLNNAGLATTQITGFYATVQQFVAWRVGQFDGSSIISGESLPFLLEGQSEGIWRISVANQRRRDGYFYSEEEAACVSCLR